MQYRLIIVPIYIYTRRTFYTVSKCKWTGYHQIQALLTVLTSDYVIYNARQFQSIATYRLSITVNEANVYNAATNIFINLANRGYAIP